MLEFLKRIKYVGISTYSIVRHRLPVMTENRSVWVSLLVVFFIQTLLPLAATFPFGKTLFLTWISTALTGTASH